MTSIEAGNVNIKTVPILGHLPTMVKITVLRLGSTRGLGAPLAPRAVTESAPFSSLSHGARSDGPPGKADPHSLGAPPTAAAFCEEWTPLDPTGVHLFLPSPSLAGLVGFSTSGICAGLSQASSLSVAVGESTGGVLPSSSLSRMSPNPSSISCSLQVPSHLPP